MCCALQCILNLHNHISFNESTCLYIACRSEPLSGTKLKRKVSRKGRGVLYYNMISSDLIIRRYILLFLLVSHLMRETAYHDQQMKDKNSHLFGCKNRTPTFSHQTFFGHINAKHIECVIN